jgi:hypothetical protein
MSTTSRRATPEQVRLLIGLSSLMMLPLLAIVMVYFTVHQAAPDHAPTWRAFAFALAVGAIMGLALLLSVPFFGGTVHPIAPVRAAVAFVPLVALLVVLVVGRLVHQAVPVTIGFIAGVDIVLATLLLIRSLRRR